MENTEYFRGGAIYFNCENDTLGEDCSINGTSISNSVRDDQIICDCNLFIAGTNIFKDNFAIHDGGAIQEINKMIEIVDEPTWDNNQAIYGPNQGKYAINMEVFYKLVTDEDSDSEWTQILENVVPLLDDNLIEIPSG